MAIKDLLVAYQGDESSQNALKFALQMGSKYGAMVTGAHVVADSRSGAQSGRWMPENVREMIRKTEREAADKVESLFEEAVAAAGPDTQHNWIKGDGPQSLLLARMSRFSTC